ncbi:electron transfer flavoprotein subunit alpha/FixB family protein [Clostridium bowmanii]|uniref:electron transfer flavoprotein subunit alpha/FixB family protein n=1 Tax=Clostridium bowmanii TaxID=132925 RepID=UPI001C0C4911|nr:electron transfer flavoprotein subunit alpha/FixB family protein [Clostridium bowmanii]MBU3188694.1 electron transfer flavoprotein subunit alpha/FixB family protein [Clostridium bowmanii]MCA1073279.1 electron transfer flavoprotein subunit alpha/FixB family protein [Clostridium bowmanii]
MNIEDYKGVWVFAEQRDGELQKVSLEILGKGREIADKLGEELTAVVLGDKTDAMVKELVAYGADKVIVAESPLLRHFSTDAYAKVICELAAERKPEIIFIGASYLGRDLGPRVSARLATGLTADCTSLDVDTETKNLLMTRPAFGGNLMATIVCGEHRPQMATIRPGVFEKLARDKNRTCKIEKINVNLKESDIRTKTLEVVKLTKDIADIGEANIIVSGGRGVGCVENFTLLETLATSLGGVVGGSRASVENGWVDKNLQVGQTGKTVRPTVYIACGISGAIQHLAGMQDSDFIIAINKDATAPIMKVADIAIAGDLMKVIPEMVAQLNALNEEK